MAYTAPPLKTALADTYPLPSNSTFKTGIAALWDYMTNLLGTSGNPEDAFDALKLIGSSGIWNVRMTFGVAAGVLTATVKGNAASFGSSNPGYVHQRNASLNDGTTVRRKITTDVVLAISNGSTLGHVSAVEGNLYWYLLDISNVPELAVSGKYQGQTGRYSTTAEGGGGGALSGTTMYSPTARVNVPGRLIGITKDTQTTAGTWAANPSEVQIAPFENGLGTATGIQTLVDGSTISVWNAAQFKTADVVLAGATRTLPNPVGLVEGESYTLFIVQDATGGRGSSFTFGSAYKFPLGIPPALTPTANAVDIVSGVVRGGKLMSGFLPDVR